jgi:asparagine synthase (glutamine-hydrolysing)
VPAAVIVDVDLRGGGIRPHRYWSLPACASDAGAAPAQLYVDRYRELLEDSIRLRMPDEVPFGVFLSGGIDSVAIAAIAARRASFPTFTVLSASTAADADSAHAIARRLTLPNHLLLFDSTSAAVTPDHWREVLWTCELPGATAEQLYKFHLHAHARARYPGLKVMLLGQGSDEFNGGYIAWTLGAQGPWDASHWGAMHRELARVDLRAAAAQAGFGSVLHELIDRGVLAGDFIRVAAGRPRDANAWRLYAGRYRGNLDYHLWHEDRTAAAHAIEDRVPFLDYRLLEHVASVPACHHAALFTDKQILRRAVADLLPAEFAKRPKGYFFYGRAQRHTLRMMYRLLLANEGELVEQALAGSAHTDGPLDANRLRAWIAELGRRPDLANLTRVLHLVNMGVLADLAARSDPGRVRQRPRLGRECTIDAWSCTREGAAALARARGTERAEDVIVALPHGCAVIDLRFSTSPALEAGVYVVDEGRLGSRIASPAWAKFLLLVDGRRSVAQILAEVQLNRTRTWRLVQSALDDGSLIEVDAAASEIAMPPSNAAPSPMAAD